MTEESGNKQQRKSPGFAVTQAYKTHLSALKRFVLRLLNSGHQHDVDDVVQEAFLRAYAAECSKEIEQPKSYLFRTAKHVALNHLREKTRRPTDYLEDGGSSAILASEWTLEDEAMARQKLEIHCAAVATLPPKCRRVYLMRKVYGMSLKEIAEMLDVTVSTVEAHISKGFARCDAYVQERMVDAGEGRRQADRKRRA